MTPVSLGSKQNGLSNPVVQHYSYNYWSDLLQISSNHPVSSDGKYREGGPFLVWHEKQSVVPSAPVIQTSNDPAHVTSSCRQLPNAAWTGTSPPFGPSGLYSRLNWDEIKSIMLPLGAEGYRKARPGNAQASAMNFALELRDLPFLPLKMLAKTKKFKSLGDEYLNYQFGWKPFVMDLQKMYYLYRDLDKQLAQLIRDNRRVVRRRRSLGRSVIDDDPVTEEFNHVVHVKPGLFDPRGHSTHTHYHSRITENWFVGAYEYYIPDIGTDKWESRATLALFGANVTPEVIWEALPWSWLIDWFSNVGTIVANASQNAAENLVSNYAYIMRKDTVKDDYYSTFSTLPTDILFTQDGGSFSCSFHKELVYKARLPATPYGFGIDYDSLSAYQVSILAALGVSRGRF